MHRSIDFNKPEHTGITKPDSVDGENYQKAVNYGEFIMPNKRWFTIKEACNLKGIAYKTTMNRPALQPLNGNPESVIGGRKRWRYETIRHWLELSDEELEEENHGKI